jgi:hypothetical protein
MFMQVKQVPRDKSLQERGPKNPEPVGPRQRSKGNGRLSHGFHNMLPFYTFQLLH